MIRDFFDEEDALGTVEILLILAGLVSIALIFKKQLVKFVDDSTASIFGNKGAGEGALIKDKKY